METDRNKRKCCRCCSRLCTCVIIVMIVFSISSVLTVGLGVTYNFRHQLFYYIVNKEVALTPNTPVTSTWSNMVPQNSSVYYFNLTNPQDVQFKGAKPIVKQIGPFVYKRTAHKDNIFWNKDETLVEYRVNISYEDCLTLSVDDPNNVKVTTVNVPLIGILTLIENLENNPKYEKWKKVFETIFKTADWINELIQYEPLFITKTVNELTFGYEDPLFSLVHKLDPSLLPSANFSLQNRVKVNSPNVVYTGKNDSKLREAYAMWNGLTEIEQWNTPTARMINGSDASFFPANLQKNDTIYAFTDELKISAYFTYQQDKSVHGLNAYRFVFPKNELDNKTLDPGFYPNGPSGVLNLTAIEPFGVPLFVSKPHFLDSDPGYVDNITGLLPMRTEHDPFLDIEPITGTTVQAAKRLQINIQLKQDPNLEQLKNLRPVTMVPIFYIDQGGTISADDANKLKSMLTGVTDSINIGIPIIIGVTCLLSLSTLVCLVLLVPRVRRAYHNKRQGRRNTEYINETSPLLQ